MQTILVTGGTGFVGRDLCVRILEAGMRPVVFSIDVDPDGSALPEGTAAIRGDVTDPVEVRAALDDWSPQGVVHMASFGIGGRGLLASADLDRRKAVDVNVMGFTTMAEAAIDAGVDRFVLTSSLTVYGGPAARAQERSDETVPPQPESLYGATKAACETLAVPLFARGETGFVALRFPTIYGSNRYPGSQPGLVQFVDDVADGRPAVLEATEAPFDWIHVTDASNAVVRALGTSTSFDLYNVIGHTSSVAEMGRVAAEYATAPATVEVVESDADAPPLMNGARAETELGFVAQYDLHSGMRQYVRTAGSS